MDVENFLNLLSDVLQRDDPVLLDMKLDDIDEYDSMSMLNVIVLIDTEYNKLISSEELEHCETVKDIIDLVK